MLRFRVTKSAPPYWGFSKRDAQKSGNIAAVGHRQMNTTDTACVCLHIELCLGLAGAVGDKEGQEQE